MFQQFESKSDPATGPKRIADLRKVMGEKGITTFLVPHADEHQNEYCPPRAERLAWLTGFTGSAGFCIVTMSEAIVFVDGRYTLQAKQQLDGDIFQIESLTDRPPSIWLKENTGRSDVVAYDPWLITIKQIETFQSALKHAGATFEPSDNLVDIVWQDQPAPPLGKVALQPIAHAGKDAGAKITDIQLAVEEKGADFCVITDPASICWLFNIRGTDVVHNPLVLGFCILHAQSRPKLFLDGRKLDDDCRHALEAHAELLDPSRLIDTLSREAVAKNVLCDPNLVASILGQTITDAGGSIIKGRDPVILPRAIKNKTEIDGARAAHLRDGVAMARFLCWLDNTPIETLDEITVAQKLETIRADNAREMGSELKEISFDTISGFGQNGAIVHYRVNTETNLKFEEGNLFLCDSGAQYGDGTTDITRTVAVGTPPSKAVDDFTLVLKGHISIALARFPKGTRGIDLDPLARIALWNQGKDYAHGTGHGIGSYLNVHEGPQGISRRAMEPLKPGMIISNEPGYYVTGEYGIRIENLVLVLEAEETAGNIATHSFETLTLCPIDLRLVNPDLLIKSEKQWLDDYHQHVFEKLSPHMAGEELAWLGEATKPL